MSFRCVVVGQSGMGKTTLCRGIVRAYQAGPRRIVILDPKEGEDSWDMMPGFAQYAVRGDQVVFDKKTGSGIAWARMLEARKRVRIFTSGLGPDEYDQLGDEIGQACMDVGDILFVADEAHRFFSPTHSKKGALARVWDSARSSGVDCLFITQMPVELHLYARKQANAAIALGLREPNDAAAGARLIRTSPDVLLDLRPFQAIYADRATGEMLSGVSTKAIA